MNNIRARIENGRVYDMKGTLYQRTNPHGDVKKDADFVDIEKQINLSEENSKHLVHKVNCSLDRLTSVNITDYSLLIIKFIRVPNMIYP